MSRAEFQLAYDGPALRAGTMNVNELASSLLAVADLLRNANEVLNAGRAEVSVRVRSDFKKGSFEIGLLLDQSLLEQAKNLLWPAGATIGGVALLRIIFGSEVVKRGVSGIVDNVLDLWKKLKAEKPKEVITDPERNVTIIVTGDNNSISVESNVSRLYERDAIRAAIDGVVRPVARQGIKELAVRKGKKVINQAYNIRATSPLRSKEQQVRAKPPRQREKPFSASHARISKKGSGDFRMEPRTSA